MVTRKLVLAARPILPILARYPRLKALTKSLMFKIWQREVRIRTSRWSESLDVNQTYLVDPDEIEYACVLEGYDKYGDRGKVIGGDWDQKRIRFTELDVFRAFEDRFIRGRRWEETEFYHRVLGEIANGRNKWGCNSQADFDQRLEELEALFHNIQTNGYKSQEEIAQEQSVSYTGEDEISVRIDRDGLLLFEDGRHRLAIAKILDIDQIPIKVTVRHSEWYQFRKEVIDYARTHGGKLYHPITHPDLGDIPSTYGHERFELIKTHLPIQNGDLLDIGAHWGYFCHRFEEEGFDCYAVESDATHIYFLKRLKRAENRKFKVVYGSIFDYRDKTNFDIVLALNIFHHFLKTEELYHNLIDLLRRLDTQVMFFQAHLPDSPQMEGAYRNYDPDEFVNFILENSKLGEAMCIGKTQDGRPIYRLQTV